LNLSRKESAVDKPNSGDVKQGVEAASNAATGITATAKNAIGEAKEKIEELREPAVAVLQEVRSAAATAGETAQDLVHRARDQATAAVDTVHQQGRRASQYLSRNTEQNPLSALLIAGAVGYGLAYLMHRR